MKMIGRLKLPFNRSWVTCPLAMNALLSQIECGGGAEKCSEITTQLKNAEGLNFHSIIFVSPDSTLVSQNESTVVDFSQSNGQTLISEWLNKYGFKNTNMCKYLSRTTDYALVNIAELQMPWFKSKGSNPVMTVYNSYSYTEDIKYEARLLKLPLDYGSFKLVMVVPTEKGTVCGLFQRLVENGVSSALQSIQPLFTVISDLKSPNINFYEENEFMLEVYTPKAAANPILSHVLVLHTHKDFYSQSCITISQCLLDSMCLIKITLLNLYLIQTIMLFSLLRFKKRVNNCWKLQFLIVIFIFYDSLNFVTSSKGRY
ncbi:uncharacterized protein LOC125057198 isoform X1 [Pieris napi]|uniref:uncharacterized protein LOC125057198 isoform X1 n=1 Tax=Pieris napi TaxID=78633 RepID=UPI001FBAE73C|nr:uncharacterized protein LOC125057198 isoform X1 [Pieris napi]